MFRTSELRWTDRRMDAHKTDHYRAPAESGRNKQQVINGCDFINIYASCIKCEQKIVPHGNLSKNCLKSRLFFFGNSSLQIFSKGILTHSLLPSPQPCL